LNTIALRDDVIQQGVIRFVDAQHRRVVSWLSDVCDTTGQGFRLPLDRVARIMLAGFDGLVNMGFIDPTYHNPDLKYQLLLALVAD